MLGIRTERWAYVTYPQLPDTEELYDLDHDPGELTSLAAVTDRAAVKADLRGQLDRLLASTGGVSP